MERYQPVIRSLAVFLTILLSISLAPAAAPLAQAATVEKFTLIDATTLQVAGELAWGPDGHVSFLVSPVDSEAGKEIEVSLGEFWNVAHQTVAIEFAGEGDKKRRTFGPWDLVVLKPGADTEVSAVRGSLVLTAGDESERKGLAIEKKGPPVIDNQVTLSPPGRGWLTLDISRYTASAGNATLVLEPLRGNGEVVVMEFVETGSAELGTTFETTFEKDARTLNLKVQAGSLVAGEAYIGGVTATVDGRVFATAQFTATRRA